MKKAMEGVTVLELSQYIAAPYVGVMLADLGADVYKIEPGGGGKGDVGREFYPHFNGTALYFATFNRNKKFITINLKSEKGQEIFKEMVKKADVVLQNYRPGTLEKFGLGYEDLKKINPGIIMTCISGFGMTGPCKDKLALDPVVQAESGFMDLTGFPDGMPVRTTSSLSDYITALYATIGTMAAIRFKEQTGKGQLVDIAMLDSMFTITENYVSNYFLSGEVVRRAGNGRPHTSPTGIYQTKDGRWIYIMATAENLFRRLFALIGRPDLIDDPRMCSSTERKKYESVVNEPIIEWMLSKTVEEASELLDKSGIPNGRVQTIEQAVQNPQIIHREMLVKISDGVLGDIPIVGNPIKLSKSPVDYHNSVKAIGAENEEVFKAFLGIDGEEVKKLREEKVI